MARPRKTIEQKLMTDKSAKILKDKDGKEHLVVVEEKTYYTFINRRPGAIFFTREDGKADVFDGYQTLDNISEKEARMLRKCWDYENGYLVEETEGEEVDNPNTLTDNKLSKLIEKNLKEPEKLRSLIENMTSDFAIRKAKDLFVAKNLPSSLVMFCDFKIKQIEEEYLETQKAPEDKVPEI
jgi:hypothetical protein